MQVVTKSAVIRADESAESGDVVGVRDELVIGNAGTMNLLYPQQTVAMSDYTDVIALQPETKTFVKTTIRKARVMANDTEQTFTGWPLDVHAAIASLVESLKYRIEKNQSIRIIVELWFDPMPEKDFNELYRDCPYASSFFPGEGE